MPIWDQADDTLPAEDRRQATPPSGDPDDIGMQHLRAKVHGRLFGAPAQPVRIGRYDVTAYLGAGGMGVVYSGVDPELDRKVALKVLRSDTFGDRARERLRREAKALARLSHPNVVVVYEVGTGGSDGKGMFVAMEFVEGGTLTEWLTETERPTAEILTRFIGAGRGLAAAHKAGLIHRDFKPDNVLLDPQGNPKVVDFGLVLTKEDPADVPVGSTRPDAPASASGSQPEISLTVTGTLMGTPAYMAPEQHRGQTADARTDVFAFCVSLYEALFGERPFGGDSYTALAQSVLDGEPTPPPSGKRKVPRALRRAIMAGLSVEPDDRPQSMHALLEVLSHPHGRRRRRAIGAGLLVVGAGLAITMPATAPDNDASSGAVCEAASTKLSGIWDDDTRARIQDRFTGVDEPYAADAFASVAEDLDQWSMEWSAVWGDACTDALGADPDEAEAGLRRMRCLDLRMTELSQLRDSFFDADASIVARAPDAVANLSNPVECIESPMIITADETSEEATELRHQLARASSLAGLGQSKRALAIADAVEAKARALALPGIVARAGLLAARLSASSPIATVQRLHRVVSAARDTDDHRTEAIAWIEMLEVTAGSESKDVATLLELAVSWADMAQAALDRRPDPRLSLRLTLAVAQVHRHRGDLAAARDRLADARVMVDTPDRTKRRDSRSILRLGQLEAEIGETDVAAHYLDHAASLKRERLGRHHPDTIAALIEAATVTRDRGKKTQLAGEAFANAVSGNAEPWQLEHAAHAMRLLTQIEVECPDTDADAECSELQEVHAVVEQALADAGQEAAEASRIANDATKAVKWSWARRPPKPAKPAKPAQPTRPTQPRPPEAMAPPEHGPAVRIGYGNNVVEVVVTDGEGARIELPDIAIPPLPGAPAPPRPPG